MLDNSPNPDTFLGENPGLCSEDDQQNKFETCLNYAILDEQGNLVEANLE